jgi:hypothetical protein
LQQHIDNKLCTMTTRAPELLKIPQHIHIRQIWHHVRHYFEASILGKLEAAEDRLHCVTPDQAGDGLTMKTVRCVAS